MPIIKFRHGQEISSSKLNEMIEILNNLEVELKTSEQWNDNVESVVNNFKVLLNGYNLRLDAVDQSLPSLEALLQTFTSLKDSLMNMLQWTDGTSVGASSAYASLNQLIIELKNEANNEDEESIINSLSSYLSNTTSNLIVFRGNNLEVQNRILIDKQVLFNTEAQTISVDGYYNNNVLSRKVFGLAETLNGLISINEAGNWVIENQDTGKPARGPTGFQGPSGANGSNGLNGTKTHVGAELPSVNNYNVGDLFFKTPGQIGTELLLYRLDLVNNIKTWVASTTIEGSPGEQGVPGKQAFFEVWYSVQDPILNPGSIQKTGVPAGNTTYIGIIKYYEGENIPSPVWIKLRADTYYPVITNGVLTWTSQDFNSNYQQSFNIVGPKGLAATIVPEQVNITTVDNSTEADAQIFVVDEATNKYGITILVPRGLTGAQGVPGTSFEFRGYAAVEADLNNFTNMEFGDGVVVGDGFLWIFTGSTEPTAINGFIYVTSIKGAKGETGNPGQIGPPGPRGPEGLTGPEGPQGLTGPRGIATFFVQLDSEFPTDLSTYLVGDTIISRSTGNTRNVIETEGVKSLSVGSTLLTIGQTAITGTPNRLIFTNANGTLDASITGNAATAVSANQLTTPRKISGVDFNGTVNITLPHFFSKPETLLTSGWNATTRELTLNANEVTTSNDIVVAPSSISEDLYNICNVRAITQLNGQLIFRCDTIPTSNLTIQIMYKG